MARWGIVSTGNISHQFAQGLLHTKGAVIAAVASRDTDTARRFADRYGAKKFYGSYKEMADDGGLDVVYIGTPNSMHIGGALMFLEAGCAVVCEKPLASNAREAQAMADKAREKKLFFMEGIWTRFFPAFKKALYWIKNGYIGKPLMVHAVFGYGGRDKSEWRFSRDMAGGALMDVGIYPLSLAFAVLGQEPCELFASAEIDRGVDIYNSFTLRYKDGGIAVLSSAIDLRLENAAIISGEKGQIIIGEGKRWWHPQRAELTVHGGGGEVFNEPYASTGFQFEAAEAQSCIERGLLQSPLMTLDESIALARTMDKLRDRMGVVFESDK
ncbi:MAG: Gfo/Idh/MocA family oxidoreductase [Christensenellales bacterium]